LNRQVVRAVQNRDLNRGSRVRRKRLGLAQRAQVKRIINQDLELKFKLTGTIIGASNILTNIVDMSAIAQGALDTERVGDRLSWCGSITFKYDITKNTANLTPMEYIRVILFQWHPESGATAGVPVAADVLLNDAITGAITYRSTYNHDRRQMYKILYDRNITLNGRANSSTGVGQTFTTDSTTSTCIQRTAFIPMTKATKKVQFTAATTEGTNKVYLMVIGSEPAGTPALFAYNLKIFFRDG